jgi:redox-sensitive bicupin YhaK (pirin superfamily)
MESSLDPPHRRDELLHTLMIKIRKSNDRGHADHGWLKARHTFSFADYYDPENLNFRDLRVINEDRVAPKMGFGLHPHRDMEIITYVVSGALKHSDSMGHTAVMRGGDVQRISAGAGIQHSEMNASPTEPVHLLQIWITPDHPNAKPAYAEKSFAQAETGRLHLVASKSGRDESIPINQDADLYLGKLKPGDSLDHAFKPKRHGWLQLIAGGLDVNGETLHPGDAAEISDTAKIRISAREKADFLLFDLN